MEESLNNYSYENALRALESRLFEEKSFPSLMEQLHIQSNSVTVSGLKDGDYPVINELVGGNVKITKTMSIPYILQERTRETQQNCMMGVFSAIDRLWITVDSQLFLWNYEMSGDPEFYNDCNETIYAINIIKPKPGIFNSSINYLLCISCESETKVIGVTVGGFKSNTVEFCKEPLFTIISEDERINIIESINGRIFLGTKAGSLLELSYWSEKPSWFSLSRHNIPFCSKFSYEEGYKVYMKVINHTGWKLSNFLPNIISGNSEKDSIIQIVTDISRDLIYTLSENSLIAQYELQSKDGLKRINYITESCISSKLAKSVSFIEKKHFKHLVHLSALPAGFGALKLLAVTQNGIRLYFHEDLKLCHIRTPPVNSSGLYGKINNVQLCCENRGSLLLLCGSTMDSQALYTINPDTFISHYELLETVSVTWSSPGGQCFSLVALDKETHNLLAGSPIIQTQHLDCPRRFLMVSRDSIVHLELPSPINYLRTILESNINPAQALNQNAIGFNPQAIEIRTWINHFGIDETIYAALVLCVQHRSIQTPQSQILSNRAFELVLYYLNESVNVRIHNIQNQGIKYECVNPFHQLLLTYIARILRPLWDNCVIDKDELQKTEIYQSTHDYDQLGWYITHLVYLHNFIRDNYPRLKPLDSLVFPNQLNSHINYGSLALEMLELVKISTEVVKLIRVLNEHQFQVIINNHLSEELKAELLNCSVKHLLLPSKRYILLGMIYALLEYYLSDGATTENIIDVLLDVCPNIYRKEDALCSKANELLVMADLVDMNSKLPLENASQRKDDMLLQAIELYEQIGPQIDLGSVVYRLRSVGSIWGAVHLCLHTARVRDSSEVAFICFRECRRPQTTLEINAVEGRNDAYKYLLECLSNLLETDKLNFSVNNDLNKIADTSVFMNQSTISVGGGDNNIRCANTLPSGNDLRMILSMIFRNTNDIMAHFEVYSWMIENNLSSLVLKFPNNHLEEFLQQTLLNDPTNVELKMILSKLLESKSRYLEAARVLDNLAVEESPDNLSLDDREICLSRAIVFVKAAMGDDQFTDYDFLKELEDKIEIIQLQKVILNELAESQSQYRNELNSKLFNVYTLLKDYVEPLNLTLSKLYILKISNQNDPLSIRNVWEEVLDNEFERSLSIGNLDSKMSELKHGLVHKISCLRDTMNFVPLDLIICQVENFAEMENFTKDFTTNCLISANVKLVTILSAYLDVIKMKNSDLKKIMHRILNSVVLCLDNLLNKDYESKSLTTHYVRLLDLIDKCLIQIQSKSEHSLNEDITSKFKAYKSLLEQHIL